MYGTYAVTIYDFFEDRYELWSGLSWFLLLTRMERETFMKKFAAFKPTSLYKVDLQRVRQAGHAIDEECEKEDIKTATW